MEINVAAALKRPSEIFEAVIEEEVAQQSYAGRAVEITAPVRLEFSYSFDGKAFTLKGVVRFVIKENCARCNTPLVEKLGIPFEERFTKEEEEDAYVFRGETLQLDTMALDNLFLHMPMQSVCEESCKGLCPVCGCNLNAAQCGCEVEEKENPLEALKSFYDDKEV